MSHARRTVAMVFGLFAGLASIEHGIGEVLQGNVAPEGVMIASWGPPCDPEQMWHLCEPAMTVIPNFLVTGVLAMAAGLAAVIWSAGFLGRRRSGLVLIGLSVLMLLFGGGLFPPVIGMIGGALAARSQVPVADRRPGSGWRGLAALWPWPLVVLSVYLVGQFVIGAFANDFMRSLGFAAPLFIIALLVLAPLTAAGHDRMA